MLILLIGPKGSGKSYVGRLLESALKVRFLHVEPLWMEYYADCERESRARSITEGIKTVRPAIVAALREHDHVCVETTGASPEILDDLISLGTAAGVLLVRIHAPLTTCLARIATRDTTHQILMDTEAIKQVYALSSKVTARFAVTLENVSLTDHEILEAFAPFLGPIDAA